MVYALLIRWQQVQALHVSAVQRQVELCLKQSKNKNEVAGGIWLLLHALAPADFVVALVAIFGCFADDKTLVNDIGIVLLAGCNETPEGDKLFTDGPFRCAFDR